MPDITQLFDTTDSALNAQAGYSEALMKEDIEVWLESYKDGYTVRENLISDIYDTDAVGRKGFSLDEYFIDCHQNWIETGEIT